MDKHGGLLHALPSRRDYFIAAALQGLLAEGVKDYADVPQLAVRLADEVLRISISPAPAGSSGIPPSAAEPPVPGDVPGVAETTESNGAPNPAAPGSIPGRPANAVFVCEAGFPSDPPCEGTITFDEKSKGRFCPLHLAVDEVIRREMHRLHGHRNRPEQITKFRRETA